MKCLLNKIIILIGVTIAAAGLFMLAAGSVHAGDLMDLRLIRTVLQDLSFQLTSRGRCWALFSV